MVGMFGEVFGIISLELLLILSIGTVFGIIIGMIPGLGGVVALALVFPLTFGMEPWPAIMLLIAIKGGTNFGGSLTSIMINTPGTSSNAATLLDGFPMTKNGEGARAIGISATASVGGALVGVVFLLAMLPFLLEIVLWFGTPEVFWLAVWGLVAVAGVVKASVVKGLISALIGAMVALVGLNIHTVTPRWTFDVLILQDGIGLVPVIIGVFAVGEIIDLASKDLQISQHRTGKRGQLLEGVKDTIRNKWLFLRSSFIGIGVGLIPGIGGSLANYLAYIQAVESDPEPERYGTGYGRGVLAPEASNDAKDASALIPTLALGIPGSAAMAVLLGAFVLHGITPGPILLRQNTALVFAIVIALVWSNILTSSLGLAFGGNLIKITEIDIKILAPCILAVTFLGAYAIRNMMIDVYITLLFGLLGYIMIRENISRVPLVLAVILTPIIEENYWRALAISGGDYSVFVRRPLTILLVVMVVLTLFRPQVRLLYRRVTA